MRIALRTGGGRGVYELAGRQGDRVASDLFGLQIFYELTPEIIIPGRSVAERRQGKPRIALDSDTRAITTHIYSLLSAVLLLPKPKREFGTTHGEILLQFEAYSMTVIKMDVAAITASGVTLRPTDLLLENADGLQLQVDFTARMARILQVWKAAEQQDAPIASQVRNLVAAIRASEPNYKAIEKYAQEIADALHTNGDFLPSVEYQLGISTTEMEASQSIVVSEVIDKVGFGVEDDLSPQDALIQRVKTWRRQVERGASGRKFGQAVSSAYNFKCLFSGQRLPRLEITSSAGVDSAHILPWSTHDLDSVRNGLCLNKQCHWAFDEGVLRLDFDSPTNTYVLSLPDHVRRAAVSASFDLDYFESFTGPIPRSRLPEGQHFWPSPTYIAELNRYMAAS